MAKNLNLDMKTILEILKPSASMRIDALLHGGGLYARASDTGVVSFRWRLGLAGQDFKFPLGLYDSEAPCTSKNPTSRGFSRFAARHAAELISARCKELHASLSLEGKILNTAAAYAIATDVLNELSKNPAGLTTFTAFPKFVNASSKVGEQAQTVPLTVETQTQETPLSEKVPPTVEKTESELVFQKEPPKKYSRRFPGKRPDPETHEKRYAAMKSLIDASPVKKIRIFEDVLEGHANDWSNLKRIGADGKFFKPFKDTYARFVEERFELPEGWLDNPNYPPASLAVWMTDPNAPFPFESRRYLVREARNEALAPKFKDLLAWQTQPVESIPLQKERKAAIQPEEKEAFLSEFTNVTSDEISNLIGKPHSQIKIMVNALAACGVIAKQALVRNPRDTGLADWVFLFSGITGKHDSVRLVASISPEHLPQLEHKWEVENQARQQENHQEEMCPLGISPLLWRDSMPVLTALTKVGESPQFLEFLACAEQLFGLLGKHFRQMQKNLPQAPL